MPPTVSLVTQIHSNIPLFLFLFPSFHFLSHLVKGLAGREDASVTGTFDKHVYVFSVESQRAIHPLSDCAVHEEHLTAHRVSQSLNPQSTIHGRQWTMLTMTVRNKGHRLDVPKLNPFSWRSPSRFLCPPLFTLHAVQG